MYYNYIICINRQLEITLIYSSKINEIFNLRRLIYFYHCLRFTITMGSLP